MCNTIKKSIEISKATSHQVLLEDGRKIIGYFCCYIPEEIIHAASMLPYRMRAVESKGTENADIYMSSTNCSFVKRTLDKALMGDFEFLSGIVFMNGCDHNRRIYDNWRYADLNPKFRHMVFVPNVVSDHVADRYHSEIVNLKERIQEYFHLSISNEKLSASISLYNKRRALLEKIYESRVSENVPIKGSELISVLLAVTAMPVEESIHLLESIISELDGRKVNHAEDIRVMLVSSYLEEREHIELIEESGATIVADKMCLGVPHYDNLVQENGDPVRNISERYLKHLSCPRMMDDFRRRLKFVFQNIEKFKADALIVDRLEFCTLMGSDNALLLKEANKRNVPILTYDRELYGEAKGQIRTRIQAFVEKVRNIKAGK